LLESLSDQRFAGRFDCSRTEAPQQVGQDTGASGQSRCTPCGLSRFHIHFPGGNDSVRGLRKTSISVNILPANNHTNLLNSLLTKGMSMDMKHKNEAFTLIELLIVVAIIGILAAIAVPNFMNARVRANASRSFADMKTLYDQINIRKMETGLWLVDGNDTGTDPRCSFPVSGKFFGKVPSAVGVKDTVGDNHYNGQIWQQLTTPTSYMNSIPVDPFAKGVFYGYEDRDCANTNGSHWLIYAAGPDGDYGDWLDNRQAKAYNPSNGIISNGDIWKAMQLRGGEHQDLWSEIGLFDTYF